MSDVTLVAFAIDQETLELVDRFAGGCSRAALLRTAVVHYLERRQEELIDEQLTRGYRALPPGEEELGMAAASLRGLKLNHLD